MKKQKPMMLIAGLGLSAGLVALPMTAEADPDTFSWRNPIVKQGVIGAAIGAGAGLLSPRTSLVKGAVVGAGAGAATGAMDRYGVLNGRPLVNSAAKGAIIGAGTGYVLNENGSGALKGAAMGAGAGAGAHLIRDWWNGSRYR